MDAFSDLVSPYILAILQGITEFLPISSSGHLILLNAIFPADAGITFDLMLHLATLISVVVFYRKDILQICVGCVREIHAPQKNNLKFVAGLLIATAITGTIGLLLNDTVSGTLRSPLIVGILLIVNAAILWLSKRRNLLPISNGTLNFKTAALIGLAQGLAVLPGISRSGSTITMALLTGIAPKDCAKISFLLSIPVILGAVILHAKDIGTLQFQSLFILLTASGLAAAIGYFSLILLNQMLKKANFHCFAPYCLTLGIITIACCAIF